MIDCFLGFLVFFALSFLIYPIGYLLDKKDSPLDKADDFYYYMVWSRFLKCGDRNTDFSNLREMHSKQCSIEAHENHFKKIEEKAQKESHDYMCRQYTIEKQIRAYRDEALYRVSLELPGINVLSEESIKDFHKLFCKRHNLKIPYQHFRMIVIS